MAKHKHPRIGVGHIVGITCMFWQLPSHLCRAIICLILDSCEGKQYYKHGFQFFFLNFVSHCAHLEHEIDTKENYITWIMNNIHVSPQKFMRSKNDILNSLFKLVNMVDANEKCLSQNVL